MTVAEPGATAAASLRHETRDTPAPTAAERPRLPRLPILDGTLQPQHRPPPRKLSVAHVRPAGVDEAPPAPSWPGQEVLAWARAAGADDVGLVDVRTEALAAQRGDVEKLLPGARSAIAFVVRMHRDNIRTPSRSVANQEFHSTIDEVNEIGRAIARELERRGYRAVSPAGGFPMEMDAFPGKTWSLSYKPIAVAAGLGQMGIHRNVIHPRFGNFISIGVVLTDLEASPEALAEPLDYNPCLGCRLCVAACPVGAIGSDGSFDFTACMTHNYREFMGGFTDWVEQIAESKDRTEYRKRVAPSETASMWQSLSFGANYKAAYCLAVCPAGSEVIGGYLRNKQEHLEQVVRPLVDKVEPVYVVAGSDAEAHVRKRFPHKRVRTIGSGLVPTSIEAFVAASPLVFASQAAKELELRVWFRFRGESTLEVTYAIERGTLEVLDGHVGRWDLLVDVDAATWLGIVRGEKNPVWAVLTRKMRVRGGIGRLKRFRECFPR